MSLYLKLIWSINNAIYGYSEEQKKMFMSGHKCPNCQKSTTGLFRPRLNYYSKNGQQLTYNSYAEDLFLLKSALGYSPSVEFLECQRCNYRWAIYKKLESNIFTLKEVIETNRSEEIIGSDKRVIDNSKSASKLIRKFALTKEWNKVYSIEYEKTQTNGIEVGFGVDNIAELKIKSEETIRKQYWTSEENKEIYSEQVEIEIPPFTKLNVIFQWKRIWQHGFVLFRNKNNKEIRIPFQIVVEITFDQSQIDEKL